jgi:hypothetical protein
MGLGTRIHKIVVLTELFQRYAGRNTRWAEGANVAVPEQVLVRLDWSEVEASPAPHINQVLAQIGAPTGRGVPDGIHLAFGSVSPPLVLGDDAQRAERVAELTGSTVKVTVLGRAHVGREVLDDIIRVLQTAAEQYDAMAATATRQKLQERVDH